MPIDYDLTRIAVNFFLFIEFAICSIKETNLDSKFSKRIVSKVSEHFLVYFDFRCRAISWFICCKIVITPHFTIELTVSPAQFNAYLADFICLEATGAAENRCCITEGDSWNRWSSLRRVHLVITYVCASDGDSLSRLDKAGDDSATHHPRYNKVTTQEWAYCDWGQLFSPLNDTKKWLKGFSDSLGWQLQIVNRFKSVQSLR